MIISKRLETIASFVNPVAKVADIGCDHAILAIFLIKHKEALHVIASDVNQGPLDSARKNVEEHGLTGYIDLRLSSGLQKIDANEIDTVVIAGMGGSLITQILTEGQAKLTNVKRIIVQPNIAENNCRKWFMDNGYTIVNETIIEENDKIYEIIVADQGKSEYSNEELEFGPILIKEKNQLFMLKHGNYLSKMQEIITKITEIDRKNEFEQKIEMYKKVLLK